MNRTLEQRIQFDHGLKIGISLVEFTHNGHTRLALIEITTRGKVYCLAKPIGKPIYSIWNTIKGDIMINDKGTVIWSNRPDILAMFDEIPKAVIPLTIA